MSPMKLQGATYVWDPLTPDLGLHTLPSPLFNEDKEPPRH